MISDMFPILFEEGEWALCEVPPYNRHSPEGWCSVIGHRCYTKQFKYFTLLRKHTEPNQCRQCHAVVPDNIVTLFKFHNWENMK